MAKKTVLGSIKRFGVRYGAKNKEKVAVLEKMHRGYHKCPYCNFKKVKRLSAGIWLCDKCNTKFAGKAYTYAQTKKKTETKKQTKKYEFTEKPKEKYEIYKESSKETTEEESQTDSVTQIPSQDDPDTSQTEQNKEQLSAVGEQ